MAKTFSRRSRSHEPLAPEAGAPAERQCIECGGPMETGFIPDEAHSSRGRSFWVAGAPRRSIWTGLKLKGQAQYYAETFRCAYCGALRSYALEPKKK